MKYVARCDGEERQFVFEQTAAGLVARAGDRTYAIDLSLVGDGTAFSMIVDGMSHDVVADVDRGTVTVQLGGERFVVQVEDDRERAAHEIAAHKPGGRRELRAVMPGIVARLDVAVGDRVEEGQTLVVLEAMKMQNPLAADSAGVVTRLHCKQGQAVAAGAVLVELE